MVADCRVRKLHIRTEDKAVLPHITFVLEDALRTASFPGIPANGKVYIRMLDLGKNAPSVSSRVLARKIDDLLRHIRPVQVTEDSPEHLTAPAVWFPDDLSPCRFMIRLLAKNHRPLSWYWSAAIRGWGPTLSVQQSLRLILFHVSEHSSGIRGMAGVLEPFIRSGSLHNILNGFDSKEAGRLLQNMALKPVDDFTALPVFSAKNEKSAGREDMDAPFSIMPVVGELLTKAIRMWSVADPRTMLSLYLVLTRMGTEISPLQVNRLLAAVVDYPKMSPDMQDGILERGKVVAAEDRVSRSERQSPGLQEETEEKSERIREELKDNQRPDMDVNVEREFTPKREQNFLYSKDEMWIDTAEGRMSGHKQEKLEEAQHFSARKRPNLLENWPISGGFAGEFSRYGGLIFLVPLMLRLGMENLLETYPAYRQLNLAERIIFRCAGLLNISGNDPALRFLGEKPEEYTHFVGFTAPPAWRKILLPSSSSILPLRMSRVIGMPGYRLLLDDRARLVIGVWHPGNRALLAPWFQAASKPLLHLAPQEWSIDRLVENIALAMIRYVLKFATMGLGDLIKRPAYIATTPTHLDVTIPLDQVDIRVRIAGLDINPGWVPWLGRVIQFHYMGGES